MKTKKPARIKGRVIVAPITKMKWLEVRIDNPDALVGQVANDLAGYGRRGLYLQTWEDISRAALRSIGVPLKKAK